MQNHQFHKLEDPYDKYDEQLKITTIGYINVGITKLIRRIGENIYVDDNSIAISSNQTLYRTIRQKKYKINLMDAMRGAERYKSDIPNYFKQSDCVIIIFDVSNNESFNQLSEVFNSKSLIQIFQQELDDVAPLEIPKVLVGQKLDKTRMVSEEQISNLVKRLGIPYFETSAKTGYNCQELINYVIELAINFHDLQIHQLNKKSQCF